MKLFIKILSVVLSLIIIIIIILNFPYKKINVGVQEDHVYYKMSQICLIIKKGIPVSKDNEKEFGGGVSLRYKEEIYGIQSNVSYTFCSEFLVSKLRDVYIVIPISNEKTGLELFNRINDDMVKKYENGKDNEKFFNEGIKDNVQDGDEIAVKSSYFGLEYGATSITIDIKLYHNQIKISAYGVF